MTTRIWRHLHQGKTCFCPHSSQRAHTHTWHIRPLMRFHGRRIALLCAIAVAVVQGFALGPKLRRTTLPGTGDSSIDSVTGLFDFYTASSNSNTCLHSSFFYMFHVCSAQCLVMEQSVSVRKQRGVAGAQQMIYAPWRCLGRSEPCRRRRTAGCRLATAVLLL